MYVNVCIHKGLRRNSEKWYLLDPRVDTEWGKDTWPRSDENGYVEDVEREERRVEIKKDETT